MTALDVACVGEGRNVVGLCVEAPDLDQSARIATVQSTALFAQRQAVDVTGVPGQLE